MSDSSVTLRDRVWFAVLRKLVNEEKFKISGLDYDESQRHTVRRVLEAMEEMEILRRESERSQYWRLG